MAYHRHDAMEGGADYHSEMPFFQEEESKYNNAKYDAAKDDPFGAGYKAKEEEERSKREPSEFEKRIEEEQKPKYEKNDEEDFHKKAADEINHEVEQHT
jgi:hypothetical protein